MSLPPEFINLATAFEQADNTFVNVIGVVTDFMPTMALKTGQHTMRFSLNDPSFQGRCPESPGLSVRFFVEDVKKIPNIKAVGDVVLLRSIKMSTYQGQKGALSNRATVSLVFHPGAIPTPAFRIAASDTTRIDCDGFPGDIDRLTVPEQWYVIEMKSAMSSTVAALVEQQRKPADAPPPTKKVKLSAATSSVASFGSKFRLIRELEHRSFADVVGQVVKRYPVPNGRCELYVTDYTENDQLFYYRPPEEDSGAARDGDPYCYSGAQNPKWPGPYGFRVLKVNVMPPLNQPANAQVEKGDIVLLRNVKCVVSAVGGQLEGDMWPDTRFVETVRIRKLPKNQSSAVADIQWRSNEYWSAREPLKPKNDANPSEDGGSGKGKAKHKNRKKLPRPGGEKVSGADDRDTRETAHMKKDGNQHVRCSHDDLPIFGVKDIVDPENVRHTGSFSGQTHTYPFVVAKYRAKVRVVDFEPKPLQKFSAPALPIKDDASDSMSWTGDEERYEWNFRLLLEDASGGPTHVTAPYSRFWVNVAHQEAQFLFGNDMDDPGDLNVDTRQLAKLREKLFILWGNLEEGGVQQPNSRGPDNLPFECCIMEYGVAVGDEKNLSSWERVYAMFGTTIL